MCPVRLVLAFGTGCGGGQGEGVRKYVRIPEASGVLVQFPYEDATYYLCHDDAELYVDCFSYMSIFELVAELRAGNNSPLAKNGQKPSRTGEHS